MRVLICGSRWFSNRELMEAEIAKLPWDATIVHGDARGADSLAASIARARNMPVEAHPADWNRYGKAAGPIRNQEMLDSKVDLVLAFPLAESRGTWDMVRRAKSAGVEVRVIEQRKP